MAFLSWRNTVQGMTSVHMQTPPPPIFSRPPRRPLWRARHGFHWLLLPPAVARLGLPYTPWPSAVLAQQPLTCRRPGGCGQTPAQALAPCCFLKQVWDIRPCGFQKAAHKLGPHNFRTSVSLMDHVPGSASRTAMPCVRVSMPTCLFSHIAAARHSPHGGPWPPPSPAAKASAWKHLARSLPRICITACVSGF